MKRNSTFKNRILLSTAVASASLFNYGRNAYAAYSGCYNTSDTSYLCNSAAAATPGLDLLTKDSLTISFDYDYEMRESFRAHTGKAKVRIEF